jgi:hypothetical protein
VRGVRKRLSVCVARVLLGEVSEVEIERAQYSHDGRPADAAVAMGAWIAFYVGVHSIHYDYILRLTVRASRHLCIQMCTHSAMI